MWAGALLSLSCGAADGPEIAFDAANVRPIVRVLPRTGEVLLSLHDHGAGTESRWILDPGSGTHRPDPERLSPFDATWLAAPLEPLGRDAFGAPIVRARLAVRTGAALDALGMVRYAWPGFASPRETLAFVDDSTRLVVVSLVDGAMRSFAGIEALEDVRAIQVSPDCRWIALDDWVRFDPNDRGRGYHRQRLVDVETGTVVRSMDFVGFLGWLPGAEPLAVADAPNGRFKREGPPHLALGPAAERPLDLPSDTHTIAGLADGSLVCTTYDGRVVVLTQKGRVLRTLRTPKVDPQDSIQLGHVLRRSEASAGF